MGHGAWFHTTAATSSADVLYAVQKGDLYRASPVDGHYTKLSSGWGDTKCLAYHGGLVYIIYKSDGRLFLYSVDPISDPHGWTKKQELPGSTARCMVSRGARLYYVADEYLYILDPVHGGAPTSLTSVWGGASCMTTLDDYVYIIADSVLYRVDPDNGPMVTATLRVCVPTITTSTSSRMLTCIESMGSQVYIKISVNQLALGMTALS